ncbi:hypothetical protein LTR85_003236 [Meristemomyces frigidus]|nr:hypothetical protein LTR85_003236 [Meristemomyces frigidus]
MDALALAAAKRDNTTPSCAVCQRRKVKCNRIYPCGPCQKTGLECSFKPLHTRHRQKRVKVSGDAEETHTGADAEQRAALSPKQSPNIRRYEHEVPRPVSALNTARFTSDVDGNRYVNDHIWSATPGGPNDGRRASTAITDGYTPGTHLPTSLRSPDGLSGDSIYESAVQLGCEIAAGDRNARPVPDRLPVATEKHFIFSQPRASHDGEATAAAAQPSPSQIIQLWQAYLANVDPMMKVFHAPTVQPMILGQIGRPYLAANEQALTSAIYLISVVSLTDEECRASLQERRSELLRRFRQATEEALSAANFITTTDVVVLQAFVLYLAALRSLGETSFVWSMTGLAVRMAGTIGVTRDGSLQSLPPFECEMRRRLWWAIVYVDARAAEQVDQDGDLLDHTHNVHLPSDMNDSELFPGMQRIPERRAAATEMIYVQLRVALASGLRTLPGTSGHEGTWQRIRAPGTSTAEKVDIVEALEKKLDEDGLGYCDITVPLQLLAINSAQTMLHKLRLVGNVPLSGDLPNTGSDDERSDNLFGLSMRIMKLQLALWTDPCLQKWRWHWQGQFQWYALAELTRQTHRRRMDLQTREAWTVIHNVFNIIIPTLEVSKNKSSVLEAIQALLGTTTNGQKQPGHTSGSQSGTANRAYVSDNDQTVPVAQMAPPFKPGMGSNPHNALLPGLDPKLNDASDCDHLGESMVASTNDMTLALDVDAIDWAEFNRLTSELCGQ